MFVSIGLRMLINVESFNAVETVGNVTKHRRAPVVVPTKMGYRLVYVPAVSGEAIANAFQRNLVLAVKHIYGKQGLKPPLTTWDERFEFVKFMDRAHLTNELRKIVEGKGDVAARKHMFEKIAVKTSVIADVGGFLYAEEALPVKRSSRIQTGYMLPTYDSLEAVAIEAQFHARHVPSETGTGGERAAQMIYYVEVASALYGLTVNLDVDGIGRTSLVKVEDAVDSDERARRVKASLAALAGLFMASGFGAKLSRFTPVKTVESAVATVSDTIAFTVSPPQIPTYIEDTVVRAKNVVDAMRKLGVDVKVDVIAYSKAKVEGAKNVGSIEELFKELTTIVLSRLK